MITNAFRYSFVAFYSLAPCLTVFGSHQMSCLIPVTAKSKESYKGLQIDSLPKWGYPVLVRHKGLLCADYVSVINKDGRIAKAHEDEDLKYSLAFDGASVTSIRISRKDKIAQVQIKQYNPQNLIMPRSSQKYQFLLNPKDNLLPQIGTGFLTPSHDKFVINFHYSKPNQQVVESESYVLTSGYKGAELNSKMGRLVPTESSSDLIRIRNNDKHTAFDLVRCRDERCQVSIENALTFPKIGGRIQLSSVSENSEVLCGWIYKEMNAQVVKLPWILKLGFINVELLKSIPQELMDILSGGFSKNMRMVMSPDSKYIYIYGPSKIFIYSEDGTWRSVDVSKDKDKAKNEEIKSFSTNFDGSTFVFSCVELTDEIDTPKTNWYICENTNHSYSKVQSFNEYLRSYFDSKDLLNDHKIDLSQDSIKQVRLCSQKDMVCFSVEQFQTKNIGLFMVENIKYNKAKL